MNAKEELLAEAALILEQEGWLLDRLAYESGSSRLSRAAARYRVWQAKVNELRRVNPSSWPVPKDNS